MPSTPAAEPADRAGAGAGAAARAARGRPGPVTDDPAELAARRSPGFAAGTGPVAVDAERASGYRYCQRAYLVQLRRAGAGTALIDPIALPDLSAPRRGVAGRRVGAARGQPGPALPGRDRACARTRSSTPSWPAGWPASSGSGSARWSRSSSGCTPGEGPLGRRLVDPAAAASWLRYAALDVEVLVDAARPARGRAAHGQGKLGLGARGVRGAWPPRRRRAPRPDPWRRTSGIHRLRGRRAAGHRTRAVGGAGRDRPPPRHRARPGAAGRRDRRGRYAPTRRPRRSSPPCRSSAAAGCAGCADVAGRAGRGPGAAGRRAAAAAAAERRPAAAEPVGRARPGRRRPAGAAPAALADRAPSSRPAGREPARPRPGPPAGLVAAGDDSTARGGRRGARGRHGAAPWQVELAARGSPWRWRARRCRRDGPPTEPVVTDE